MEGKGDDTTPAKNLEETALEMDISSPLPALALVVPPLLGLQTVQGKEVGELVWIDTTATTQLVSHRDPGAVAMLQLWLVFKEASEEEVWRSRL